MILINYFPNSINRKILTLLHQNSRCKQQPAFKRRWGTPLRNFPLLRFGGVRLPLGFVREDVLTGAAVTQVEALKAATPNLRPNYYPRALQDEVVAAASLRVQTSGNEECSICGTSEGKLEAVILADLDFVNRRVTLNGGQLCCEICEKATDLSLLLNYSFQAGKSPGASAALASLQWHLLKVNNVIEDICQSEEATNLWFKDLCARTYSLRVAARGAGESQIYAPTVSYSNLLEELVLALVGVTGDVFVDADEGRNDVLGNPDKPSFHLAEQTVTWVTKPDKFQLEQLLRLGFHYQALDKFVESCQLGDNISAYKRALGAGVSELLDVYQAAIVQVQQHLRTESTPVVPAVKNFLIDFQTLLPQVHRLIYKVHREALAGADLLRHLHSSAQTGLPTLQSCIRRLLWHCHQVLYKQLSGWMVHGQLVGDSKDFFITKKKDILDAEPSEHNVGSDPHRVEEFRVELQRLPPYIYVATAEHVKFIGKAVQMLRQPKGRFRGQDLLPYKNTLEYADSLRKLQEQPVFQRVAFERTIEGIRSKVAQQLWHLVVVKAQLRSHLQALRNYFLLASGEFFHNFLLEAREMMHLPVREATVHADITAAFDQSASKSTVQHDKFFSFVTIRWSKGPVKITIGKNKNAQIPVYDPNWDDLHLDYEVGWPLFSIITQEMLEKYNAMFMLLLRLKRVRLGLEEAWLHISSRREDWNKKQHKASDSRKQLWQLHQHIFHFITNMEIYLQVDVIEANYTKLLEEIDGTQDFMRASKHHEKYLKSLLLQSFMHMRNLVQYLTQIFSTSRELCTIIKGDDGSDFADAANSSQVDKLVRGFNESIRTVYTLLQSSRLQELSKTTNLRQLYMRLNFNDYIDKKIIRADSLGGRSWAVESFDSRDIESEEPSFQDSRIPRARTPEGRFPTPRKSTQMDGGRRGRGLWEDRMDQS